jgi:hypothetical protein
MLITGKNQEEWASLDRHRKLTRKALVGSGLFFCLSTNSGDKTVKKLGYAVSMPAVRQEGLTQPT